MYKSFFKRFIDLAMATTVFVLLSPVFLLLGLLLCIVNQGSPFFTQKRPGKNNRIFTLIKLKTMSDRRDDKGVLLSDDQRLTKVGTFIRSSSLDEWPQLINVILGDMSLVGPRPLLVDYIPYYTIMQIRRHEVRPGITGWAQVNGRNLLDWDKRFEFDVWYVDHVSFMIDMRIMLKTLGKVFRREGISANGHATMPNFIEFLRQSNRKIK